MYQTFKEYPSLFKRKYQTLNAYKIKFVYYVVRLLVVYIKPMVFKLKFLFKFLCKWLYIKNSEKERTEGNSNYI